MIDRDEQYNDFKNNASCIAPAWACEDNGIIERSGHIGRPCSGIEGANDENGSNFWFRSDKMDPICDLKDSRIAEHELGFREGYLDNLSYYRFDDRQTDNHNYRIATGREPGTNEYFTGRDKNGNLNIEIYNGKTSGGGQEMVSDRIPTDELIRSENPITFSDPNVRANDLLGAAEEIKSLPNNSEKEAAILAFNQEAHILNDRINNTKNYLDGRISEYEKTMSENPVGSLEYNRALDNKNWCENYNHELENSKKNLQDMRESFNGGSEKEFKNNKSDYSHVDRSNLDTPAQDTEKCYEKIPLDRLDSIEKINAQRQERAAHAQDEGNALDLTSKDGLKM